MEPTVFHQLMTHPGLPLATSKSYVRYQIKWNNSKWNGEHGEPSIKSTKKNKTWRIPQPLWYPNFCNTIIHYSNRQPTFLGKRTLCSLTRKLKQKKLYLYDIWLVISRRGMLSWRYIGYVYKCNNICKWVEVTGAKGTWALWYPTGTLQGMDFKVTDGRQIPMHITHVFQLRRENVWCRFYWRQTSRFFRIDARHNL